MPGGSGQVTTNCPGQEIVNLDDQGRPELRLRTYEKLVSSKAWHSIDSSSSAFHIGGFASRSMGKVNTKFGEQVIHFR